MDNNSTIIISLIEKATEYGKTSIELGKLKALDIVSDVVSSIIPQSIVLAFGALFILFLNLGIAFWIGEITGKISLGFVAVAAFYGFIGIFIYLFLYKRIKKLANNYIIKKLNK